MDIPYSGINVRKLLHDGRDLLNAKRREREAEHAGLLRAGSAGCLYEGRVYGECARIARARLAGADKPIEPSRHLMFHAGEGNEDLWEQVLVPSWQGQVLRGQALRRTLLRGDGLEVLGSPDLVLADAAGEWQVLLELKLLSATNSTIARVLGGSPDSKHLVQSAAYMWLANKPAILCYTNRADFAIEFQRKKYGVAKIEPCYRLFYLAIKNDRLYYRDEFETNDVMTNVTTRGIEDYYEMVAGTTMPPRPESDHVDGSPAHWQRCDARYCAFSETCDRHERDYVTWLTEVRRICATA